MSTLFCFYHRFCWLSAFFKIMPKKFKGENSKAVEARARKSAQKDEEEQKKQRHLEEEFWKEDDKHVLKKLQRKVSDFCVKSWCHTSDELNLERMTVFCVNHHLKGISHDRLYAIITLSFIIIIDEMTSGRLVSSFVNSWAGR